MPSVSAQSKIPKRTLPDSVKARMRPRGERPADHASFVLPPRVKTTAGLERHDAPLTRRQATHLLRRTCFGAPLERVNLLVGMHADEAANFLVEEALAASPPDPPEWHAEYPPWGAPQAVRRAYNDKQDDWFREYTASWIGEMLRGGLREKMTLFWHNHFVTERATYFYSIMAYKYLAMLRTYALGNFRDFVGQVGINPAMLVYLDGNENSGAEPNENYARELLELFTMGENDQDGQPNYTQEDVVAISRALAGWYVDYGQFVSRIDYTATDNGEKEVFGQRSNYDFGSVHTVIFEQRSRQIAEFIVGKLYAEFIYVTPDETIVSGLADLFLANDFEIAPVLRTLLQSAHFFEDAVVGAKIKSPVELFVGTLMDTGRDVVPKIALQRIRQMMVNLGQSLLNPPNVGGWTGYRDWITTASLPSRWQEMDTILKGSLPDVRVNLVPVAQGLVDPSDPLAVFKVPVALVEHMLSVPATVLSYDAPPDFHGDLDTFPIPEEVRNAPPHVADLTRIFLGNFTWYEWNLERQGIAYGMAQFLNYLTKLPEYQLG